MSENYNNSFVSMINDMAIMNKNSVEVLSKLNDVVTSSETSITINREDNEGNVSSFQIPTVNQLKKNIDILTQTVNSITNPTNTSYITDGNNTKKFVSTDLKREPVSIPSIDSVNNYNIKSNWFFESLMNPLLSVKIDLNDKITTEIGRVLSRRYIIKFEVTESGEYTDAGASSLNIFKNKFLNKNDFSINDFLSWLSDTNNKGVIGKDDISRLIDEEEFPINYKNLKGRGYFSVYKMEVDDINNKIWYHLNTSNFETKEGGVVSLTEGNELVLSKRSNITRYRIIETSNNDSDFKIALERLEGFDPVPIGENVLEYYSEIENDKYINVSVGFNEYNVLFLKSINTDTNIISSLWSKGTSFFTNDLLNSETNVALGDYYNTNVNDYGKILQDYSKLYSPIDTIVKPPVPVLDVNNFKVVQINKHLTDNENTEKLGKLQSKKESTKSKIEQITKAITDLNNELNGTSFSSTSSRQTLYSKLNSLYEQQESENKTLSSIIQSITSSRFENVPTPKYSVRGFWEIPGVSKINGIEHHIIKFLVQYRYSSKGSDANSTEGFSLDNFKNSNGDDLSTGYFSNWNELTTKTRERLFNKTTNKWEWKTENLTSGDEFNINSLDINIKDNEKIEVRIKSISNVGYPLTQLQSEWSNIMQIEFPSELSKNENYIQDTLDEASKDEVVIRINENLNSKGLFEHTKNSYIDNDTYIAHSDRNIVTSFSDNTKTPYTLSEYLNLLTNKITVLEEKINKVKGELQVILTKGSSSMLIKNNSTNYITIECEDYSTKTPDSYRTYVNEIKLIKDYNLSFRNISNTEGLSFLTNKNYIENSLIKLSDFNQTDDLLNRPCFVNQNNGYIKQVDKQKIWLCDKSLNGDEELYIKDKVSDISKNLGKNISTTNGDKITNEGDWSDDINLKCCIMPMLNSNIELTDIKEKSILEAKKDINIPINIYFKLGYNSGETDKSIFTVKDDSKDIKTRKIRFYTQTGDNAEPFTFELEFTLNRFKEAVFTEPPIQIREEIETTTNINTIQEEKSNYTSQIIRKTPYDQYNNDKSVYNEDGYWNVFEDEREYEDNRWYNRNEDDIF